MQTRAGNRSPRRKLLKKGRTQDLSAADWNRTHAKPAKCTACNRPMDSPLFCGSCHTLHPPEGLNLFQIFELSPTFDVDLAELRRRYLRSSRAIHPDHHGSSASAAALSLRTSARLNEAYRVLSDPLSRAEYLLELAGGNSSAADKSVPREVLTQTLMLREEIEEARLAGDLERLQNVGAEVQNMRDEALKVAAELARQLPATESVRQQLRQKLNAVKYYQKLVESL
jgi:molecular chaperone HscB